ncbi:GNAT family N-acetyltransferase [Streptomyces hygroscopicus]|uniref:GNAT family N-acetyltransferase n=1 Tax=Streptomyces hygroscopicus TaxID=1912 RepID=UPI0036898939
MSIELCDSVDALQRRGYDDLVPHDHLYLSAPWLRVEEHWAQPAPFHLVVTASGAREPGGVLSCFPLDETSEPWPFTHVDVVLERLMDKHDIRPRPDTSAALTSLMPTILCGGRRTSDTRMVLSREASPEVRRGLCDELLDSVERAAVRADSHSITLLYVEESDEELRGALTGRGFLEFPTDPCALLTLTTPTFDGYRQQLPRSRRGSIARERRKIAEAGVTIDVVPIDESVIDELAPLQEQHHGKYGVHLSAEKSAEIHRLLMRYFESDLRVVTARSADGALRGFTTFTPRGGTLHMRQAGFDYEWKKSIPLYFETVFYTPVQYALDHGIRHLDYSIASEDVKLSRGCELVGRYGYVKLLDNSHEKEIRWVLSEIGRQAAIVTDA